MFLTQILVFIFNQQGLRTQSQKDQQLDQRILYQTTKVDYICDRNISMNNVISINMNIQLNNLQRQLNNLQVDIERSIKKFEQIHQQSTNKSNILLGNNQKIVSVFISAISSSAKILECLLVFVSDRDIMNLAATCKSLYRFIYSPMGYRILNTLKPVLLHIQKKQQAPLFSQSQLQNLCSDRSLVNLDDDDKVAIILTMQTNLIATKHKIYELQQSVEYYDKKTDHTLNEISYVGGLRDEEMRNINNHYQQIQKLEEILKQSEHHVRNLKQEQQKMLFERTNRLLILQSQKYKLEHQKQLLIKKIKSQQKQKEEGLTYSRQVNRIIARLDKIIGNKK